MSRAFITVQQFVTVVAVAVSTAACASPAPPAPGARLPQAPAGLGTNPQALEPAAPPPAESAAQSALDFSGPIERLPFSDPVSDAAKATGAFSSGNWVTHGGYLEQNLGALSSSLSFRQYTGSGFGTEQGLPSEHYRVDVTVWVYQPSAQYPDMVGAPLGILGYAPYFIDETRYLLAVAKPSSLEVWAVDGYRPATEWPLEARVLKRDLPVPLVVGTPVAWSVEIDTAHQSARVWANGEELATVKHPLLVNRQQRVALVSNGNYLHFQDFRVFRL